jgi:hypothetical protein
MSQPSKKKRQHYVPRLVLRNFSLDGRTISVLVFSSGKHVTGASLRDQCYVDYFYGKDPRVENQFAEQEAAIAQLLIPTDPIRLETLRPAELTKIKTFVFQQRQRTLAAARAVNDSNNSMKNYLLGEGFRFSEDDLRVFEKEQRAPQDLLLKTTVLIAPLISDLEVKFLIPSSALRRGEAHATPAFVISDAPIANYNQWAEHHPKFSTYSGYKGIACKGLQWFYPFAPDLCICVYDPTTYLYGGSRRHVCKASRRDIRLLNELQAIHAKDCLYYVPSRTDKVQLDSMRDARSRHQPLRTPLRYDSPPRSRSDGTSRQLIKWTSPDARIGAQFQFARVIDASAYEHYDLAILPIRSQQLYAEVTRYDRSRLTIRK